VERYNAAVEQAQAASERQEQAAAIIQSKRIGPRHDAAAEIYSRAHQDGERAVRAGAEAQTQARQLEGMMEANGVPVPGEPIGTSKVLRQLVEQAKARDEIVEQTIAARRQQQEGDGGHDGPDPEVRKSAEQAARAAQHNQAVMAARMRSLHPAANGAGGRPAPHAPAPRPGDTDGPGMESLTVQQTIQTMEEDGIPALVLMDRRGNFESKKIALDSESQRLLLLEEEQAVPMLVWGVPGFPLELLQSVGCGEAAAAAMPVPPSAAQTVVLFEFATGCLAMRFAHPAVARAVVATIRVLRPGVQVT